MSKTKTLFTMALLVLLGSMGAAQAQNILYEVKLFTTPAAAARREAKMRCPVASCSTLPRTPPAISRSLSITPSLSQAT